MTSPDKSVTVVGSGPNGLAAAVVCATLGYDVNVFEAQPVAGGGTRTLELTLPGFQHDVCSAVHPLGISSPLFRALRLEEEGLNWIQPAIPFAHPLGKEMIFVRRSVDETAAALGVDESAYKRIFHPLVKNADAIFSEALRPVAHLPRHPLLLARFGYKAALPATVFARTFFRGEKARALFAGVAAHTNCPLERAGSSAVAFVLLVAAHAYGWPIAQGGSRAISDALVKRLKKLGGQIHVNHPIQSLKDLPPSKFTFFDLVPSRLLEIARDDEIRARFPNFRHGPGIFKIDWALDKPIPWTESETLKTGTLHLGGSMKAIAHSEAQPELGRASQKPYVLLSQPSLFDSTRAPSGQHTGWAYCHVPNGSLSDQSEVIEAAVEEYAPGFKASILSRNPMNTRDVEAKNSNLVGGDIGGGTFTLWNFLFPQAPLRDPYALSPSRGYFICSSSTPPGPGVHGLCGLNAALSALRLSAALTPEGLKEIGL